MLVIYFDYLRAVRLCEPLYCDTSKSYDRCCIATMVLIGGILFGDKISKRCRKRQRCCWWDFAIYHLLGYLQPQMGESTLAEYKALLDTAKEKSLVIQLGYMYRYNPAVLECFERIKKGELGEIHTIHAEMSTLHPTDTRRWLTNFRGGGMYIFGSHLVDLIVYLLGEPKKISSFVSRTGLDGVDLEDNNLAVLEYDKAMARIFVSSVEVNGFGRRQFMVGGSLGTANICPLERPITMTWSDTGIADKTYEDRKITLPFEDHTASGRYDEMMQDFHAYILGEKQNPFTYEHDYSVQKVLDEIVGGVGGGGKKID